MTPADVVDTSPGRVSATALIASARSASKTSGRSVISEIEAVTGARARDALAEVAVLLGLPFIETSQMLQYEPAHDVLPLAKAMQRTAAFLRSADASLIAVIHDPFDADLRTWVETRSQEAISVRLALRADIQAYLIKKEETVRAVDTIVDQVKPEVPDSGSAPSLSYASIATGSSPAVSLLNSTLYDALKMRASDIHLESTPTGLAVKFRIDGVLDPAITANGRDLAEQVISRLKVLAELDISERRTPQDGSFRVASGERDIDLRVSIIPSIHGEDAVIRILDKRAMIEAYGALTLEALGFDAGSLVVLRHLVGQPHGMLLVTGPTGSGKTTTLYAALSEINHGRDKIITIEDPVEYQLPGILQIPVNDKKGLTFARGLRSILRHDPDKMMVGEIRDKETAEIAVQSALTGHLVLTTVHANNSFDVFGRFAHMGIDPYAFVSALNGIWAQRLIRINCPHCAREVAPQDEQLEEIGISQEEATSFRFMAGSGCGDCRGTGFKGRRAIAEILKLTDELRESIVARAPVRQIKAIAHRNGTRTLREAALDVARRGQTTVDEIKRVTLHS